MTKIVVERSAALGGGVHDPSDVYVDEDRHPKSHSPAVLVAGGQTNKGNGTVYDSDQTSETRFPHEGMFAGENEKTWGEQPMSKTDKPTL